MYYWRVNEKLPDSGNKERFITVHKTACLCQYLQIAFWQVSPIVTTTPPKGMYLVLKESSLIGTFDKMCYLSSANI